MLNNPNFSKTIISWYLIHKRDLPWRHTKNAYFIWLSEIILQQTQVAQGLPYYQKFIGTYPTVYELANAKQDEVLKLWQGLGYYSRARNLHETAKHVVQNLNGKFPEDYKGLLKLKGVGDYTASAIASICYEEPVAVVDGNVYRVLSRYFNIDTPINSTAGIKTFKALAQELIDIDQPALFNQAIMEFGARQCKPKSPNCRVCPLNESCLALAEKKVDVLPVKLKKTKVKTKHLNYLVLITKDHNTQLSQRKGKGIWQGLYEFPNIETEKELSPKNFKAALEASAFDFVPENVQLFNAQPIVHKLSHQHLHTKFWILNVQHIEENSVEINDIEQFPVPVLIENFITSYPF